MGKNVATNNQIEIQKTIQAVRNEIAEGIAKGWIQESVNGLVPTVYMGKVSARRFYIGWNYQAADAQTGDAAILPCPEHFVNSEVWIVK